MAFRTEKLRSRAVRMKKKSSYIHLRAPLLLHNIRAKLHTIKVA